MHCNYEDILSRVSIPPLWFDEHAVPRYCLPEPHVSSNIYADKVGFFEIACQGCDHRFLVEMTETCGSALLHGSRGEPRHWHYGDPPNINCCGAGPTMNSVPIRIVVFYERKDFKWEVTIRDLALDVDETFDNITKMWRDDTP